MKKELHILLDIMVNLTMNISVKERPLWQRCRSGLKFYKESRSRGEESRGFYVFCRKIGMLPLRATAILDRFMCISDQVVRLIRNSFLSEKMKRNYRRNISEMTSRFVRK